MLDWPKSTIKNNIIARLVSLRQQFRDYYSVTAKVNDEKPIQHRNL